jgi:aspartate-semialdehyde dehydrogenase
MSAKGDARIPVGVLGATGVVGQRMVRLLEDHPWFRLATVTASDRSAGRPYAEATRWIQSGPIPEAVAALPVRPTEPMAGVPLVFSALDSSVAGPLEERFAGAGILVVSNARNHRMDPRVPLLVPEVNPGHLDLLDGQEYPEGGGIITNPNCSTIGLSLVLGPLHAAFGVEAVHVVTLQALSGAGLPGHAALEMQDNVIPFISGEEEKLEAETLKILGSGRRTGWSPPASRCRPSAPGCPSPTGTPRWSR